MSGGKLRTLTAEQARRTLVHRLTPLVDRMRQRSVELGLQSYDVSLVWTRWSGGERGEGREALVRRLSLLPSPTVEDLTGVALQPYSAGVLPVGSVRVSRISPRYAQDLLMGLLMPCDPAADFASRVKGGPAVDPAADAIALEQVTEPTEFFYEVVEDGRSNNGRPAPRARFRPLSQPFRRTGQADWSLILERVSEDLGRDGLPDDD